jgi:tight adherence protein B
MGFMITVNSQLLISLIPATMVVFLVLGLYKTFLEKQVQSREHIRAILGEQQTVLTTPVKSREQEKLLKRRKKNRPGEQDKPPNKIDQLEAKLERANLLITPKEFLFISLGVVAVGGILGWLLSGGSIPLGMLFGSLSGLAPYLFVIIKAKLRMAKAAAQFADVLDSMVNAFKTGFGFSRAVQMVADNFDDPWGTEFGKMAAEMNLGSSMEDALNSLTTRVPSPDVDLFVTALLIQKETGGSMAELLGNLSKTIRDRYKLFQKVSAISAQGKLSAGIVSCVPFLLCGIMFMFLPDAMMNFVTNPIGIVLFVLTGFWMLCGIGVLYKIVQIEV